MSILLIKEHLIANYDVYTYRFWKYGLDVYLIDKKDKHSLLLQVNTICPKGEPNESWIFNLYIKGSKVYNAKPGKDSFYDEDYMYSCILKRGKAKYMEDLVKAEWVIAERFIRECNMVIDMDVMVKGDIKDELIKAYMSL